MANCIPAQCSDKLADRFWSKVDRSGGLDACWPFTGYCDPLGYGRINVKGVPLKASRVAYALAHGGIPDGAIIRHSCDNPPCCNPEHLAPGSQADNTRDKVERGRQTRGELCHLARVAETDVIRMRELYSDGWTTGQIAAAYRINTESVRRAITGIDWGWVPGAVPSRPKGAIGRWNRRPGIPVP